MSFDTEKKPGYINGRRMVTWGLGIEQEVVPIWRTRLNRRLSTASRRLYPVAEAFIMRQSFWSAVYQVQHDADGGDTRAYPMIIKQDHSGLRPCIECITRDWEGRTLSQQVADLLQTRDLLLHDINTMSSGRPGSRPDSVIFPEQGADYLTYQYKDKSLVDFPHYLGSYHINITLPHAANTSQKQFIRIHEAAAQMVQWIEPLLMAVLGCPSPACILDGNGFTQLSVRHGEESLATALGSNIGMLGFPEERSTDDTKDPLKQYYERILAARYPRQREDLVLRQPDAYNPLDPGQMQRALKKIMQTVKESVDKFPEWIRTLYKQTMSSPLALRRYIQTRYGAILSNGNDPLVPIIGTDFRRDPSKGKGFGFEFRLLDYFPAEHLTDVLRLLFYVMDASVAMPDDQKSRQRTYNAWLSHSANAQYIACILEGWNTRMLPAYSKNLSRVFGLTLSGKNCTEALDDLCKQLFGRYGRGRGRYSRYVDRDLNGELFTQPPKVCNINRRCWEQFFERRFPDVAKHVRMHTGPLDPVKLARMASRGYSSPFSSKDITNDLEELRAYQRGRVVC